jgi:hypothetical protein
MYRKIMLVGAVLIGLFNPLAVALWSDALITGLNWLSVQLIAISEYSVIVGFTLLAVGGFIYWEGRSKKNSAKLKKLKTTKTSKAGAFID